jgi:hypothetical protein
MPGGNATNIMVRCTQKKQNLNINNLLILAASIKLHDIQLGLSSSAA